MLTIWLYSLLAIFIVSTMSLAGVLSLSIKKELLQKILLYFVSLSAGALIGDSFIHLLPNAVEHFGFGLLVSLSLIFGILFSFIIETMIQWRHHHHIHGFDKRGRHMHHKHSYEDNHPYCSFAYMNLVGDSFHNFIDGIIIATSFLISTPVGIATTIAVILHEIPQELGDFGILLHGGFKVKKAILYNFLTACVAFLGGIIALLLGESIKNFTMFLIPFAAGNFIYIAISDLFPELRKETNMLKSSLQLFFVLVGIGLMALLLVIG